MELRRISSYVYWNLEEKQEYRNCETTRNCLFRNQRKNKKKSIKKLRGIIRDYSYGNLKWEQDIFHKRIVKDKETFHMGITKITRNCL